MMINYWDCKYRDYNEFWDGEEESRVYGCTSTKNTTYHTCKINNKWAGEEAECPIAEGDCET